MTRDETIDKGHGRIETRRIRVRTKLPSRLDEKWPDIKAICRIERSPFRVSCTAFLL